VETTCAYLAGAGRYDKIRYRRTDRSGVELLSLGFWQNFGGDRRLEAQRAVVHRAFDLGIMHFGVKALDGGTRIRGGGHGTDHRDRTRLGVEYLCASTDRRPRQSLQR
jgi:hypothetical protein